MEALFQQRLGETVLDLILDNAAQRPRAEQRVEPLLADPVLGGVRHLQRHVLIAELILDRLHLVLHDRAYLLLGEGVEHHRGVQAVQELRPEDVLHRREHLLLHLLVFLVRLGIRRLGGEPQRRLLADEV